MNNKREEFRKKYEYKENNVDIMPFMKNGNNQKTYTAQKGTMQKANKNKKKHLNKRAKKLIGALLAGTIALGAYGTYKAIDSKQTKNPEITVVQALENGESLNELGINEKIVKEIKEIQEQLNQEDISNSELIQLSIKINNLQFDTIKTKLSNALGVDEEDIKLFTGAGDEGETRETIEVGSTTYRNRELFNNKDTMTDNIAEYIKEIGDMQTLMGTMQSGNFDRNDVIEEYKDAIESTTKFAAGKMSIDKKGNISLETQRQQDLVNAKSNEQEKGDEGIEL